MLYFGMHSLLCWQIPQLTAFTIVLFWSSMTASITRDNRHVQDTTSFLSHTVCMRDSSMRDSVANKVHLTCGMLHSDKQDLSAQPRSWTFHQCLQNASNTKLKVMGGFAIHWTLLHQMSFSNLDSIFKAAKVTSDCFVLKACRKTVISCQYSTLRWKMVV